jgi:hypothetical protein
MNGLQKLAIRSTMAIASKGAKLWKKPAQKLIKPSTEKSYGKFKAGLEAAAKKPKPANAQPYRRIF